MTTKIHYPTVQSLNGPIQNIHYVMSERYPDIALFTLNQNRGKTLIKPVIEYGLANDFGHFSPPDIAKMSQKTLVAVGVAKSLLEKRLNEHSYTACVRTLTKSAIVVETTESLNNNITSSVLRNDTGFNVDGTTTPDGEKKVRQWLKQVLIDDEVYDALELEKLIPKLASLLVESSNLSRFDVVHNDSVTSATLIDVGVIRFPDVDAPYFYVYQFKLSYNNTTMLEITDLFNGVKESSFLAASFKHAKLVANDVIIDNLNNLDSIQKLGEDFYKTVVT